MLAHTHTHHDEPLQRHAAAATATHSTRCWHHAPATHGRPQRETQRVSAALAGHPRATSSHHAHDKPAGSTHTVYAPRERDRQHALHSPGSHLVWTQHPKTHFARLLLWKFLRVALLAYAWPCHCSTAPAYTKTRRQLTCCVSAFAPTCACTCTCATKNLLVAHRHTHALHTWTAARTAALRRVTATLSSATTLVMPYTAVSRHAQQPCRPNHRVPPRRTRPQKHQPGPSPRSQPTSISTAPKTS